MLQTSTNRRSRKTGKCWICGTGFNTIIQTVPSDSGHGRSEYCGTNLLGTHRFGSRLFYDE